MMIRNSNPNKRFYRSNMELCVTYVGATPVSWRNGVICMESSAVVRSAWFRRSRPETSGRLGCSLCGLRRYNWRRKYVQKEASLLAVSG